MRRTLGPLLLTTVLATGLLAGCGADSAEEASDPAPTAPTASTGTTASPAPDDRQSPGGLGTVEATTVDIVSATSAGGEPGGPATVLDGDAAVSTFTQQFTSPELARKVAAAADGAEVPAGQVLVASVVAVGCDVPSDVSVQRTDEGLTVTALKVATPRQECFAPVTSVALVAVDETAV
ncbi:hypothetical protein H5V45_07305 [Nocardioides sp. KIGAM211]|uniref:Lipoprotein n=1 Tax=Nocardioides luti TaxID=2761101 RepID=A0A7X0RGX6_9ACTN|nr:hypothetical protein [Nocardioides luti]MBB6627125.1 hypothetical protein [Nocardioides luti]